LWIGDVDLTVSSLERSVTFYTERLGFKVHARERERAYLDVSDLAAAEAFYVGVLGFELMQLQISRR
jgi:catechol 2,3-dioxygenase-like lactoylglutathione lyase family enzyme